MQLATSHRNPNEAHIMVVPCNLEKVEKASMLGQRFSIILINLERIQFCQVLRFILPVNFCGLYRM